MRIREARAAYIRWLRVTKDVSPHTIRAYDGDLAHLERFLGSAASVDRFDREDVVSFFEQQKADGLAASSLRRRASAVRGFCRWMHSEGWIGAELQSGTSIARSRSRKLPRALTRDELAQLIRFLTFAAGVNAGAAEDPKAVRKRPHEATTLLAVAMIVATGVRVQEAVGLKCGDIDLSGRTVRLMGKGQRERQVFLTNDWIAGLTSAYLVARAELGVQHARLFFNLRYEPLTPPTMRARLSKAAKAAGLDSPVTPHMLRHTAATQLIEAGVDIRYIQRLLGHASLTTTEIYTHVSDLALRRVVSDADVLGRVTERR